MFDLRIVTENAAFEGNPAVEVARILRETADKLLMKDYTADGIGGTTAIRDENGNKVGYFRLTED